MVICTKNRVKLTSSFFWTMGKIKLKSIGKKVVWTIKTHLNLKHFVGEN
jgi:hypothetical protein